MNTVLVVLFYMYLISSVNVMVLCIYGLRKGLGNVSRYVLAICIVYIGVYGIFSLLYMVIELIK